MTDDNTMVRSVSLGEDQYGRTVDVTFWSDGDVSVTQSTPTALKDNSVESTVKLSNEQAAKLREVLKDE